MRRGGTAIAVNNVTCLMISRKDIEATLGSSITHLKHYNIKKWALMRSNLFKHLNIYEINNIITEFVVLFAKDKTVLDSEQHKGFIVCLEGKINGSEEGIVFNEDQWTSKSFGCGKLVKNDDGHYGFLSFKKASSFFEGQQGRKKVLKNNNVSSKAKSKAFLKDFQYLKKLGEGQFGQVYLVKNIQYGTNLYAIKCLSKEEIRK
jgi:cGMP-dependent protein kinase